MSTDPVEAAIRALVQALRDELAKQTKPANDDAPTYVTPAEYARARSISESTVRAAIREKRLEHIRIGRAVRIPTGATIGKNVVDEATERARLILMRGGKGR
jgi:excisionase family DNA binding protein